MPRGRFSPVLFATLISLAACRQQDDSASAPQRIDLTEAPSRHATALPSPDTTNALWSVSATGQAIDFGPRGAGPLMTLACELDQRPVQLLVIRHAPAFPGQTALFPVIGNGMRSRFLVDAQLAEGEWRWQSSVPAADPQLDVFTGTGQLIATLPGGGTLDIPGSRIPGEFITWCRAGGAPMRADGPVLEAVAQEEAGVTRNENGDLVD